MLASNKVTQPKQHVAMLIVIALDEFFFADACCNCPLSLSLYLYLSPLSPSPSLQGKASGAGSDEPTVDGTAPAETAT